jgi:hypothetical protein
MDIARTSMAVRRGRAVLAVCWTYLLFHAVLLVLLTPVFNFWVSFEMGAIKD